MVVNLNIFLRVTAPDSRKPIVGSIFALREPRCLHRTRCEPRGAWELVPRSSARHRDTPSRFRTAACLEASFSRPARAGPGVAPRSGHDHLLPRAPTGRQVPGQEPDAGPRRNLDPGDRDRLQHRGLYSGSRRPARAATLGRAGSDGSGPSRGAGELRALRSRRRDGGQLRGRRHRGADGRLPHRRGPTAGGGRCPRELRLLRGARGGDRPRHEVRGRGPRARQRPGRDSRPRALAATLRRRPRDRRQDRPAGEGSSTLPAARVGTRSSWRRGASR